MLANKLALVTGGASGIGHSIAKLFAKQGANVAIVDMSPKLSDIVTEIKSDIKDTKISTHLCDVSDSSQVNKLFQDIQEEYPQHKCPSIVINSAGIIRDAYMTKLTEKMFDEVIDVNLKGTFLVTQAASKALIANFSSFDGSDPYKSYASIVNISSIIGQYGASGQSNYSASKAAVDGFTKSCSKELGKFKIRCNTIQPGFIATPMTSKINEQQEMMLLALTSLKRLGRVDDIAQLALFLASENSSFITGTAIECNGGLRI